MRKKGIVLAIAFLCILAALISFTREAEGQNAYKDVLVYVNDPLDTFPNVAVKYAVQTCIDIVSTKGIVAYPELKLTWQSAAGIASNKGTQFVLEIKGSLFGRGKSTSGYYAEVDTIVGLYNVQDEKALVVNRQTYRSENALSQDIAYSYALANSAKTALLAMMEETLKILKK